MRPETDELRGKGKTGRKVVGTVVISIYENAEPTAKFEGKDGAFTGRMVRLAERALRLSYLRYRRDKVRGKEPALAEKEEE